MINQLTKFLIPRKVILWIGALVSTLFGAMTPLMVTIAIFLALDWITGIAKAIITKKVESKIALKGILKIGSYLIVMILGYRLSLIRENEVIAMVTSLISNGLYCLIALCELISCIENLEIICEYFSIDLPILRVLKKILKKQTEKFGAKK